MGIEIWVEDDDCIRCVKIYADTTSPCGQKIDENIGAGLIEFVNALLSERAWGITVQSKMFNLLSIQEIFDDVENNLELCSAW